MTIPLNGRVAIVDDQIIHAQPLMAELSKRQIPFTYFSGDYDSLPAETDAPNDIRILFLDINLIDDSEHENKVLKSRLIPVLKRVVSKNNHPYVIVYWSRHDHHKHLLEDEIFKEDIADRAPIKFLSANKSDYFDNTGIKTDDFDENIGSLFENIENQIKESPVYSYILQWENLVHKAADLTLQGSFSANHTLTKWENNANYIFNSLGKAYLGKHFVLSDPHKKIVSSSIALTSVFKDSLEHAIFTTKFDSPVLLEHDKENLLTNIEQINFNLNASLDIVDFCESGVVIEFQEKENIYKVLLNKIVSFFGIKMNILKDDEDISSKVLSKLAGKEHKRIKDEIKKDWKKIGVVVTPVCDFAQNNKVIDRIVKGVLVNIEFEEYLEKSSEAIYQLPFPIILDDKCFIMVLDFRYFMTYDLKSEKIDPLFRLRQELLSEIQSKLSRHINRQGMLLLSDY